jgi:hypothetical protein
MIITGSIKLITDGTRRHRSAGCQTCPSAGERRALGQVVKLVASLERQPDAIQTEDTPSFPFLFIFLPRRHRPEEKEERERGRKSTDAWPSL